VKRRHKELLSLAYRVAATTTLGYKTSLRFCYDLVGNEPAIQTLETLVDFLREFKRCEVCGCYNRGNRCSYCDIESEVVAVLKDQLMVDLIVEVFTFRPFLVDEERFADPEYLYSMVSSLKRVVQNAGIKEVFLGFANSSEDQLVAEYILSFLEREGLKIKVTVPAFLGKNKDFYILDPEILRDMVVYRKKLGGVETDGI